MIEINGNIWNYSDRGYICIPTNGDVNSSGRAVMGRGLALQASRKFPGIDKRLGMWLSRNGNVPAILLEVEGKRDVDIITIPVKHHWHEKADLSLIEKMTIWLAAQSLGRNVYLPRLGCGNGGLDWKDVRIVLEANLIGDKFIVVNYDFSPKT